MATDDIRTTGRYTMELLDKDKIELYLEYMRMKRPMLSSVDNEQAMELLNICKNMVPTLAAILNFGIYPQGIYPQYGITAIAIQGYEMGYLKDLGERIIENRRIKGTIADMVDEAKGFCIRNMKVSTVIDNNTGKRRDKSEYPLNAIREAVLNALIHRDYSIYSEKTSVQIIFYMDRLEIHSPGNLHGRMTAEQLGVARPDLRNPVLAVMAENLTVTANRYSGIPTIRREIKDHGLPNPIFENRSNEFVVIFNNTDKVSDSKRSNL